jgi:excisionase family DNA binding protein
MSRSVSGEAFERSLLIDDAAQRLGVSRRTVYYRIRQGRLQTIRTRCGSQRVLVSSIELLLESSRQAAGVARPPAEADLTDPDAGV